MNIVLDFDRTLFDTKTFADWFFEEVAQRSGTTAKSIQDEAEATYFMYQGTLWYYDMFAQLESIFGADSGLQLEAIKQKALKTKNFLFDDFRRNFDALQHRGTITILTYGKENAQQFKLSLCPELRDIPVIIVMSPKGPHIEKHFDSKTRCVFVDDKDVHGELPSWVAFYQILRNGAVANGNDATIHSFDELVSIVSMP
jgi:hypothetical protein